MTDVLKSLGFYATETLKVAIQQDPVRVQKWLTDNIQIKKRAIEEGAAIYWGDEMGLSFN